MQCNFTKYTVKPGYSGHLRFLKELSDITRSLLCSAKFVRTKFGVKKTINENMGMFTYFVITSNVHLSKK